MKSSWVILFSLSVSTGCYRYTPTPLELVPIGDNVQIVTTRDGARDLVAMTDVESAAPVLEGVLAERDSQTVTLTVPVGQRVDGFYRPDLGATVRLDLSEVLQASRRDLNLGATALLFAGTVAVAVVVVTVIMDSFRSTDRPPSGGPIESILPSRGFRLPSSTR